MSHLTRNPGIRRIMREAKELSKPTYEYYAHPLEEDMFEWHFTIRGPRDTPFDGGIYHGIIRLPTDYPMKPPSIIINTPNGRFEVGKRICLSMSDYHPETWQPAWTIRTVLLALIAFFPTPGNGAIGSVSCSDEERRKLAKRSLKYSCPKCGACMHDTLLDSPPDTKKSTNDSNDDDEAVAEIVKAEAEIQRKKQKEKQSTDGESEKAPSSATAATPPLVPISASSESHNERTSSEVSQGQVTTHHQQQQPHGERAEEATWKEEQKARAAREDKAASERIEKEHEHAKLLIKSSFPPDKWKFDALIALLLAVIAATIANSYVVQALPSL